MHSEVCVCVHIRSSQCLTVCGVCNHSIKSTAITNRISWVDSRSLSLLIDFRWFPSAHKDGTLSEWPRWESLLWAWVNVLRANISETLQSRRPSFCVRKSQISQSYQGQQMLPSLLPVWKIQFDSISSEALRDQWNQWIAETVVLINSDWVSRDTERASSLQWSICFVKLNNELIGFLSYPSHISPGYTPHFALTSIQVDLYSTEGVKRSPATCRFWIIW